MSTLRQAGFRHQSVGWNEQVKIVMRPEPSPILDYGQSLRRVSTVATVLGAAVVFVSHGLLQFLLYRGRAVNHWAIANSDFVVFAVPNLLALTAYALLITRWARAQPWLLRTKTIFVVVSTMAAGFLSMWGSLLIPFNTYGT